VADRPTGQWLYISITISAEFPLDSTIYRIRLVDNPTAADMQLVTASSRRPSHRGPAAGNRPGLLKGGHL